MLKPKQRLTHNHSKAGWVCIIFKGATVQYIDDFLAKIMEAGE